jgi:hypothetical protein
MQQRTQYCRCWKGLPAGSLSASGRDIRWVKAPGRARVLAVIASGSREMTAE